MAPRNEVQTLHAICEGKIRGDPPLHRQSVISLIKLFLFYYYWTFHSPLSKVRGEDKKKKKIKGTDGRNREFVSKKGGRGRGRGRGRKILKY